jgi:hypothetical protein
MRLKTTIAFTALASLFALALAQSKSAPFDAARDFPRGALVYVQIADLPALIRLLKEARFTERYLGSRNYQEFANNHLGRKLASRWREFNDAAGFALDFETLSGLAENRAALALYDVGKLDFVFVAPISNEIFAATGFARNRSKFEAQAIDEKITVYRAFVDADRGRQKQELIYAHLDGRLIVATSEKLLARTVENVRQKGGKNSLADEPAFKLLSEDFSPRAATVWVDQEKLNTDYYFKRYWLMSEISELENIKAGFFDLAVEDGRVVERRKLLLDKPVAPPAAVEKTAAGILAHLPENTPFYRLQAADREALERAVRDTIFERRRPSPMSRRGSPDGFSRAFGYFASNARDYASLGEDFDAFIDETDEPESDSERTAADFGFAGIFPDAAARTVLTFTDPHVQPAPLFVEFRRGAVIDLAAPKLFRRDSFEAAIAENFTARLLISDPGAAPKWTAGTDGALNWRELSMPMLGLKAAYAVAGNRLILANDPDFLKKILTARETSPRFGPEFPFNELTVLDFERREAGYDRVFAALAEKGAAPVFFTGNIKSLLDAAPEVEKIEIKRIFSGDFQREEIVVKLRAPD